MKRWNELGEQEAADAAALFAALYTLDRLDAAPASEAPPRPANHVLYAYAAGRFDGDEADLAAALAADGRRRAELAVLLRRMCRHRAPVVRAASSGDVTRRDGDGFSVRWKPSRADSAQSFVIIELDDPSAPPPAALVVFGGGHMVRERLAAPRDGVVQILTESDSALLRALKDLQSEVFLQ